MSVEELPFSLTRHPLRLHSFFGDDLSPLDQRATDAVDARRRLAEVAQDVRARLASTSSRPTSAERAQRRRLQRLDAEDLAEFAPEGLDPVEGGSLRAAARADVAARSRHRALHAASTDAARAALLSHLREHEELVWSLRSLGSGVAVSLARLTGRSVAPDARARKHELVFTRVLTRAGMKTSPISRFARIEVNSPTAEGVRVHPTRFSLNNAALFELFEAVALSDDGIDHFAWEARPYTSVVDGRVVAYTEEWNGDAAPVYRTRDGAVRLPSSPLLVTLITPGAPWTVGRMTSELGLSAEAARTLLRRLVERSVFRPAPLPSDRRDLALSIAELVEERIARVGPSPALSSVADATRRASALLARVNHEPELENLRALEDLLAEVRDGWHARGTRTPATLVYEDNVGLGPAHRPLGPDNARDLARLLRLWPLFDINVRMQLSFARDRDRWHGTSAVAPAFFTAAAELADRYRPFWTAPWTAIPTDAPDVQALDDLRAEFVEGLRSRMRADPDAEEIAVDGDHLDSLAARMPADAAALSASYTVFSMTSGADLVVNKLYPGHLAFLSRFLRHTSAADDHADLFDRFYADAGTEVADVYETNGFNATARSAPFLRRRLVSPYTRDRDADTGYRALTDVSTAHLDLSRVRPLLVSEDGTRVQPVVTSNLLRTFLPPYTAFTANLYGNINHLGDLAVALLPEVMPAEGAATPRVRIGSVVVERRHWFVPADVVRRATTAPGDEADRHVELVRVLTDLGLPFRFFFRTRGTSMPASPITSITAQFGKPQYVDVRNPLLVSVLRNAAVDAEWVVAVEALPDAPHACESVREFKVEGR